jgi:hypothetical protein
MNAPNRTSTPVSVLSAVGFAVLGLAFFDAARWAAYSLLPAALMALLLVACGWFGLRTVLAGHPQSPVRRSAHVLLWLSLGLLLVGAVVQVLRPDLATGTLTMRIVGGCMPLVGIVIYWAVLARKRAAEA